MRETLIYDRSITDISYIVAGHTHAPTKYNSSWRVIYDDYGTTQSLILHPSDVTHVEMMKDISGGYLLENTQVEFNIDPMTVLSYAFGQESSASTLKPMYGNSAKLVDWCGLSELEKCKKSPYYYATTYLTINGERFTTKLNEDEFNTFFIEKIKEINE